MEQIKPSILQQIQLTKSLPDLPNGVTDLLNSLFNDEIDFNQLTRTIERHPAIVARLISLANSAWSTPISPITTIDKACSRLGFTVVRNVSIALSISSPFNTSHCPSFDIERFWMTCMLSSETVSLLSSKLTMNQLSFESQKTVQTAAIIHNIGLLWLVDNMRQETEQALLALQADPDLSLNDALKSSYGVDYCEIGYFLGKHWKIPEILLLVIKQHRNTAYQGQFWQESCLIGLAAYIVRGLFTDEQVVLQNEYLERLQINQTCQEDIFHQMKDKVDSTRLLAKALCS